MLTQQREIRIRLDGLERELAEVYGVAEGGLSPRSVRYIATILHAAFGAGVKWGRLVRNPSEAAEPPSARRAKASVMKTWTADELRAFLHAEVDDRHHPIWLFLATTGCRRGEALGLRWVDVDLKRGTATLRQTVTVVRGRLHRSNTTKTGDTRVVRLDAGDRHVTDGVEEAAGFALSGPCPRWESNPHWTPF